MYLFYILDLTNKAASLEDCFTHTPKANLQYVEALGSIITELMNGYVKEGAIGVDDLHRWPPGSNAVTFLSETTSAVSIFELTKVCYQNNIFIIF